MYKYEGRGLSYLLSFYLNFKWTKMFEVGVFTDSIEEKFKLITENVNELISIVNEDYKIEFINKVPHLNVLDYNEEDLNGKSWLKLVHPKDLKKVKSNLKLDSEHMHLIREIRLIDKKGNFKKFKFDVRAFVDSSNTNKFIIILSYITKLIDKRETEQQLKESEEKFRTITEQSLMGIIILQNSKIQYINKTAAHMVEYTPNEILNFPSRGFINLVCPADRKMVIKQAKKRQRGIKTKITGYECRCLKKNGDLIWLQIYSKTITYKGKFADLITVIDITDKKKAEIKSKESEQTLRYLLSSNPIVIYTSRITESRVFTFVSENVRDMTGYSPEDFIKKSHFWNLKIHPDDKDRIQSQLRNLSKKENLGLEYRFRFKDGIYHWIQDEFKIVKDKKGLLLETIGSWVDVTVNKKIEEKVKYQAKLVETISDAIISTDLKFNIITWNKAAESIYGWKAEEVKRKNINDLIPIEYPYDDQDIVLKEFFEIGKWKGEVIQTRKNGNLINILTSISMIKDINGKPIGVVAINRDITERKKVENKLKESEEKFRTIAEQTLLGIKIIQNSSVIFVNQAVSTILEYPFEELKSWFVKDILNIIYEPDLPPIYKELKSRKEDDFDSVFQDQCRIYTKLGKLKWIEVMSKPIIYQGRPAIILSVIDITTKKKVEEELKEINKLKSEFLSRTSHELKTPLVSIKGYVDFLLNVQYEELDLQTITILQEIKQGCSRLESLIKDILETSKLESDRVELKKSIEDLSFLIRFCLKDLQGLIDIREHEIFLEIQDQMILMFEKERIYEVIINLLSNAIKYTPPKGSIKFKSKKKEDYYIISIKDNGIGVTEEEKSKLFKKFGKIEHYGRGLDVISEGSGLGLYISKMIVELHGGKIWVESEGRNKGSTFYFSLPIIKS